MDLVGRRPRAGVLTVIAAVAAMLLLLAAGDARARPRTAPPVDYMAPFGHVDSARGTDDESASVEPAGPPVGAAPAAATSAPLVYHGGPVMRTNTTYAIYWIPPGQTVSAAYRSTIDGYLQNVAAASGARGNVYAASTDYSDTTGPLAYSSTFGGSVVDTAPFPASGCSDAAPGRAPFPVCLNGEQLGAEIQRVVTAEEWPVGTGSLFLLYTPKNVGSCSTSGYCFAQQYCAYHTYTGAPSSSSALVYAVVPYAQSAGNCSDPAHQGSPNHDDADLTINTTSHEHIEAITNPLITAWLDASGEEGGDKCAWSFGTPLQAGAEGFNQRIGNGVYSLQEEWSNSAGGCVLGLEPGSRFIGGLAARAAAARDVPGRLLGASRHGSALSRSS